MPTSNSNQTAIQKINIKDVIVSEVTKSLYDYSNREDEINALAESISLIGQREPIQVIRNESSFILIDGRLRLYAMIRLNLNEIDAIISEFVETDEFSFTDLIIHHQIRKKKTSVEKLNEVKALLRLDSESRNPLRDKEKRVTLISSLLGGKGWGRNNVYSLENILRWEKRSRFEFHLAEKVVSNELSINKALETIRLTENPLFDRKKEKESRVVDGFLKGNYDAEQAVNLMGVFSRKKSEGHTKIRLYQKERKNFKIIQGNIEEIQLPEDLAVDTIFTSPSYFRLVKYGNDPHELGWENTPEEYIQRLSNILMKCYEKLKSTGSMFVNLGETYEDGECLGITEMLTMELKKRGARFVDRIVWNKVSTGKPNRNNVKRLNSGYETILHFSKTKDYYFERFKIKSKKTLRVSRSCKEKGSNKRNYHIPNNYSQFRSVLSENNVTNVINVQINKNRTIHIQGEEVHPAVFSNNLPVIPLLISTPKNRDSVVMDPFLGTGSCGVVALQLGFRFVGVELYEKNVRTAERILTEGQESFDKESLDSLLDDIGQSGKSEKNSQEDSEAA